MEPPVFEALEHCLAGNRAPGWARRSRRRAARQTKLLEASVSSLWISRRRSNEGSVSVDRGSLGSPEGLFGRSHSRSLTPMHASRVTYSGGSSSHLTKVRRRPSSNSPAASPVSAPPDRPVVKQPIRPKTPKVTAMSSQTPLPADFLEQPWVQRYLNETKGLLSVLTLENLAARWELERTNPAEAKAKAKARAERSPAAQARRRKREAAQRHQVWLRQQLAKEAARREQLQAERQKKEIRAEEEVSAEVALAAARSAAAAQELAQKEAAAAYQRKSEEQQISATMIQKVYRGKSHRAQHEALLKTPIAVVSIIGGPGSGKTTLCKQLVADEALRRAGVSLCHLSIGSLLRKVAQPRSNGVQHPHAEMIRVMMEGGELVPDYIVCDILQKEITKVRHRAGRYADSTASQTALPINLVVLDGFPVNVEQANMLDKTPLASIILLDCDAEESVRRVIKRSETSGRADDTESTAYTALARFEKHSTPLIKDFAAKNLLVRANCGVGQSKDDVYGQLLPRVMAIVDTLKPSHATVARTDTDALESNHQASTPKLVGKHALDDVVAEVPATEDDIPRATAAETEAPRPQRD